MNCWVSLCLEISLKVKFQYSLLNPFEVLSVMSQDSSKNIPYALHAPVDVNRIPGDRTLFVQLIFLPNKAKKSSKKQMKAETKIMHQRLEASNWPKNSATSAGYAGKEASLPPNSTNTANVSRNKALKD